MKYLQWVAWGISLPLQAGLLTSLFRGGYRSFPPLLPYSLVLFLWTVANIAAREGGRLPATWQSAFWMVDLVLDFLLYLLVLTLVSRSLRENPNRGKVLRILALGISLFWLLTLLLTREPRFNWWMTNFTKYVTFGGAILNLLLWATLIQSRRGDRGVLMISGGYGIQSAGEAVGKALRDFAIPNRSFPLLISGNVMELLTHSICLIIWWRAVAHENALRAAGAGPGPLTRLSPKE